MDIAAHECDDAPRAIGEIARSQSISAAFISRLAVPLKRAKLIHSVRGAGGGLRLAKSPDSITLLEIAEALDGPVSILKCLAHPKSCKRNAGCKARAVWGDLNLTIRNALAAISLTSVIKRLGAVDTAGDYCI